MSSTQYARPHQLRYDDQERQLLARLLIAAIEQRSTALAGRGTDEENRPVQLMRSLLDRI